MSSYEYLSSVYDELSENVDYDVRSDYISDIFCDNSISSGTVLDLACGTASMSERLMKKGYSIIGIDLSEQMLEIASQRLSQIGDNFTLLKANMQDFELETKVDACICCLDSINHLNSINAVQKTFECVNNSLKQGGLFVFDVNTIYKHQCVLSGNTFVFDEEDYYLVWDNEQVDENTVRILIDLFRFNGQSYDRFSEEFCEKAYSIDELKTALENSGFSDIKVYDELTYNAPEETSERLFFVCKKA